jgi:uncharacterized protein YrzB (UPF0473 family)
MDEFITMVDEQGNELEFEFLDYVSYKGDNYAVMLIKDDNDGQAYIFKVTGDVNSEEYEYMDDDELCDAVFEEFKLKSDGDYVFE